MFKEGDVLRIVANTRDIGWLTPYLPQKASNKYVFDRYVGWQDPQTECVVHTMTKSGKKSCWAWRLPVADLAFDELNVNLEDYL